MKPKYLFAALLPFALYMQFACTPKSLPAKAGDMLDSLYTVFKIKPSETDTSIKNGDGPHLVVYDKKAKQGKLMIFLTGTGGVAVKGPHAYYQTVVEQGYRLISLSYIDVPAVAQVCTGDTLKNEPDCAAAFREKRIYGKGSFPYIIDKPQDAIVNRLIKLLQYLSHHDKDGNWGQYLTGDSLKWGEIAFSGQSQGGGMSEYIGKHEKVYKIISFSGGWDWSAKKKIANWYGTPDVTPHDAWYGTYNVNEPAAKYILAHLQAEEVPEGHTYGLDLPVRENMMAHSEGVANSAYKPKWIEMLGRGN